MAVTFIQAPPTYAGAFAPIEMVVGAEENEDMVTIYVMLVKGADIGTDTGQIVPIERTVNPETHQATIDLSYLGRLLFIKDPEQMKMPDTQPFKNPSELVGELRISPYKGGTSDTPEYIVTVFNTTETNISPQNNPALIGRLLNGMPMTYYQGYPMPIAVRKCTTEGQEEVIVKYFIHNAPVAEWTMTYPVTMLPTPTAGIDSIRITVNGNGGDYKISEGCIPEKPYYIRWINMSGGWSYAMFSEWNRVKGIRDVNNAEVYTQSMGITNETLSIEAYEVVDVGKELMSDSEYRTLSGIMFSPLIQWWNADAKRWYNIVINGDMSLASDVNNGLGSVQFSFLQPHIKIQF